MESQQSSDILHDFSPRLRVYNDGRVERLRKVPTVPPSYDSQTRVQSKDVIISSHVSARMYMPLDENNTFPPENMKLPLYIYFHGGAFCLYAPSTCTFHNYINSLVSEAKVIIVSVDYRLAPEFPIPTCYDDSWVATEWVLSHSSGSGPDPWLNKWADFGRLFITGDSAGANIAHNMVVRAGSPGPTVRLCGLVLVQPFFGNGEVDEMIDYLCEGKLGVMDPRMNPAADPARMREDVRCERVLVCVDEQDGLKDRGLRYYEVLKESGWKGEVELVKTNGGGHGFHISLNAGSDEALKLVKFIASFVNNNEK